MKEEEKWGRGVIFQSEEEPTSLEYPMAYESY